MSIRSKIKELEKAKKLHCLESRLPGEETVRTLWVSSDVLAVVMAPEAGKHPKRLSEFREFLDAFLEGGEMTIAENPKDKPAYAQIARVNPVAKEFWDFRVTAPKPGIRAFGAFADFDTFVVLTWEYREGISDFDAKVRDCIEVWNDLFGDIGPYTRANLDEYLSNYTAV